MSRIEVTPALALDIFDAKPLVVNPPVKNLKQSSKKETVTEVGRLGIAITTTTSKAGGKGCTI